GSTTRKVLRDVEGAVFLHLVALARIQVEREERGIGGREADEAKEPALAACDLEQRQSHRLRPDLLLPGHRRGAVETDDHRPPAASPVLQLCDSSPASATRRARPAAAAGSASRARAGISRRRSAICCAL